MVVYRGDRVIGALRAGGHRWEDLPLWVGVTVALGFLLGLLVALVGGEASRGGVGDTGVEDGVAPAGVADAYSLQLAPDGSSVTLSGLFDFGITRALEGVLEEAPGVRLLRLESAGGRVAEARGVARLVHRHALVTSAVGECSSACTLVLLSAAERYLEPGARLGFHRYGQRSPLVGIFLDSAGEQARDRNLFRGRAVAEAFLERVEATPHETMWFPTTGELIAAGVVDAVGRPD